MNPSRRPEDRSSSTQHDDGTPRARAVTGVILAGGTGRRMGGVDKGLVALDGKPMVEHVLARLAPQVDAVLINANQNLDRYARLGVPVVPDAIPGFAGPLAGFSAGLAAAMTEFVVTVPCDSPFLPHDLVARLMTDLVAHRADLAVARTTPGTRRLPPSRPRSTTRPMRFATSTPAPTSPPHPGAEPRCGYNGRPPPPPPPPAMTEPKTLREASCADDYDPESMPVERARALIRTFLHPVTTVERVAIRSALGRVLAADVTSPIDVPGHDNSAMDGYAVRFADLASDGETVLRRVGESFAGKPAAQRVGAGECVRIFTGAVMPAGADACASSPAR